MLVVLLGACACSKGVDVDLVNSGTTPVENVRLDVRDGSGTVDALSPGEARRVRLVPRNETDLAVQYDCGGARHVERCCYLENYRYTGAISVTIGAACKATIVDDSSPTFFP